MTTPGASGNRVKRPG
ncbi:unnamed protein product, partial [Adineta steineri]